MDLNYLHYRQQIELMRADTAGCGASRSVHQELAVRYSRRIAAYIRLRRAPEHS